MTSENGIETWEKIPPVCMARALSRFIIGSLYFSRNILGTDVAMDDGRNFRAFRHLTTRHRKQTSGDETVFIVRFRFKRYGYAFNRAASIIPIPLIAGTPGFQEKLWAVDDEDGTWQGMYQFETSQAAEDYRESLVFRVMSHRAVSESLFSTVIPNTMLFDFIDRHRAF